MNGAAFGATMADLADDKAVLLARKLGRLLADVAPGLGDEIDWMIAGVPGRPAYGDLTLDHRLAGLILGLAARGRALADQGAATSDAIGHAVSEVLASPAGKAACVAPIAAARIHQALIALVGGKG